ncbi:MAG: hypothetical protein K0Q87_5474 [Neobacillus sp.]|jgi:hypothetical protein|nr:hypothetical protein [Neobacillus sp.]
MTILRNAVEKRKTFIINRLIKFGFTKMNDGRQLYELPLTELERIHIEMMCDRGKKEEVISD